MRNRRFISILLTLCMALSLLPTSAMAAKADQFTDVAQDAWYYEDVDFVAKKGYFKGMSDTIFAPDATMTRAMFVTVMSRFAGVKVDDTTSTFTDVPAGEWYTGAIAWAAKKGIVNGRGNGIFDPNGNVTREEMCTILDRYLEAYDETAKLTKKPATITDLDTVSAYATEAVKNCVAYGVIIGYPDGTFGPKITASRAHVAAILHRLQLKVSRGGYEGGIDLVEEAVANVATYVNANVDQWAPKTDALKVDDVNWYNNGTAIVVTAGAEVNADRAYLDIAMEYAREIAILVRSSETVDVDELKALVKADILEIAGRLGYSQQSVAKMTKDKALDTAIEKAQTLRTNLRAAAQTYVVDEKADYAFDRAHVYAGETELFDIDFVGGLDRYSIDMPEGVTSKRELVKMAAVEVAEQLAASLEAHTDPDEALVLSADMTVELDIKEDILNNSAYECTDTVVFALAATVDSDIENLTHYYDAEADAHNVEIIVPQSLKNKYNQAVAKIVEEMAKNVLGDLFDDAQQKRVATYAQRAIDPSMLEGFNLKDYLTGDVIIALANPQADQKPLYDIVDKVIMDAVQDNVTSEKVDEMLQNAGLDMTMTEVVETLNSEEEKDQSLKELMAETMVKEAGEAVKDVLVQNGLESSAENVDFIDYVAHTAVNKVVADKAAEMTEEKKAEAEAKGEEFDEETQGVKGDFFAAAVEEKKEVVMTKKDDETQKTPMDNVVQNVVKEQKVEVTDKETGEKVEKTLQELIDEKMAELKADPMYAAALEIVTYDLLTKQTFGGLANLLDTDSFDGVGDKTIGKITAKLDELKLFVPASAELTVGDAVIDADMLSALRDADDTEDVRLALIDICAELGDLCLADFADGETIVAKAGGRTVTVNLFIK